MLPERSTLGGPAPPAARIPAADSGRPVKPGEPAGTADLPNGRGDVPNGRGDLPNGRRDLPNGRGEVPNGRGDATLASLERGLDALNTSDADTRPRWRRVVARVLPPVLAIGLILLVWQVLVWSNLRENYSFPAPSQVWSALATQWHTGALERAVWLSVSRAMLGFGASVLIGTPLGLLVARVRPIRAAIGPILSGLQSLPSVAWVPAGIIWFGLSKGTIFFVVLLGAVPSIANGTVSGVDQVPPLYLRVGRVLGARGLRSAWHIVLPAALPGYLGGLKQGWAFAWRSLMAAELITQAPRLGTGLGQLLDAGRELADVSLVFGMIVVILLVGVAIDQLLFSPVERGVLRRRGLTAR